MLLLLQSTASKSPLGGFDLDEDKLPGDYVKI